MFKSQFWTPNTDLSSDNFDQMNANDTAVHALVSNYYGHGLIVQTFETNFAPDFAVDETDASSGGDPVAPFDEKSQFQIYVHGSEEFWRFGVYIPRIYFTPGDTASTAVSVALYERTPGVNESDTFTRIGATVALSNEVPNQTYYPGLTAQAQFLVQFASQGTKTLQWVVQPFTDDVQEFEMRGGSSASIQYYAMCLGVLP